MKVWSDVDLYAQLVDSKSPGPTAFVAKEDHDVKVAELEAKLHAREMKISELINMNKSLMDSMVQDLKAAREALELVWDHSLQSTELAREAAEKLKYY